MHPKADGILESSLVSDLPRSIRFYRETFGFPVISDFEERGCTMRRPKPSITALQKRDVTLVTRHDARALQRYLRRR